MASEADSHRAHKEGLSFEEACLRGEKRREHTPLQRALVNSWIVSFLLIALLLSLSESELVSREAGRRFRGYFAPLGMKEYWRLYGPDLREYNFHTTAVIQFVDGTCKLYEFPRMDRLSVGEKFVREKERSLFAQMLPNGQNKKFYPAVCRYLARANADPQNPPVKVTVIFMYIETPPPDPKHWIYRDQMPFHSKRILHFVYNVVPSDLVNK